MASQHCPGRFVRTALPSTTVTFFSPAAAVAASIFASEALLNSGPEDAPPLADDPGNGDRQRAIAGTELGDDAAGADVQGLNQPRRIGRDRVCILIVSGRRRENGEDEQRDEPPRQLCEHGGIRTTGLPFWLAVPSLIASA